MRQIVRTTLILLISSFGVQAIAEDATGESMFSPADIFNIEYGHDPRISPDGKQVVYLRHGFDKMTDQRIDKLWMVNTDGSTHRPLASGNYSVSSPRWSPEGDRIAYVSTEGGSPQIYLRWMDTGQTTAISTLERPPANLSWSPNGKTIAFTMLAPAENPAVPPLASGGGFVQPPPGAQWAKPMASDGLPRLPRVHPVLIRDSVDPLNRAGNQDNTD